MSWTSRSPSCRLSDLSEVTLLDVATAVAAATAQAGHDDDRHRQEEDGKGEKGKGRELHGGVFRECFFGAFLGLWWCR